MAAAARRYSREDLLRMTFHRDPRLRVVDFTNAMVALDRIPDREFSPYDLAEEDITAMRLTFSQWPRDAGSDASGHAAHQAVATNTRSPAPGGIPKSIAKAAYPRALPQVPPTTASASSVIPAESSSRPG